jgi:caffeoyl-CoA O-methyltransferase
MKRLALAVTTVSVVFVAETTLRAQPRPGGPPPRINPLVRLFDADGNGTLSETEIAGAAAKLKEFDKNTDGNLTNEELRGALPFGGGRGPFGGGRPPLGGGAPGGVSASDLQKESLAQDETEKKILATLKEMIEGEGFRNVSPTDGRLLRMLAEAVDAKRVVEIGTSTGESAVWLALAVQSTGGHVSTHEIDEGRAKTAQENFEKAGVDELISLVLGNAHETVARYKDPDDPLFVDTAKGESIDILFLDADKEGYIDYMNKLMPLIRVGGLIIAHNMNTRMADPAFVKAVTGNPQLETLILLKEGMGVGVTLKKR